MKKPPVNCRLRIDDPDAEFFGQLASYLGMAEKYSKREDGYQVIFLGIELDPAIEARFPVLWCLCNH